MGVVARRPMSSGAITGASLLQEGATARAAFSSLAAFCRTNGIAVPKSLDEALPLVQGWYTEGQDSLGAARVANEATVADNAKVTEVTQTFDAYKRDKTTEITRLKAELEIASIAASGRITHAELEDLKKMNDLLKGHIKDRNAAFW